MIYLGVTNTKPRRGWRLPEHGPKGKDPDGHRQSSAHRRTDHHRAREAHEDQLAAAKAAPSPEVSRARRGRVKPELARTAAVGQVADRQRVASKELGAQRRRLAAVEAEGPRPLT